MRFTVSNIKETKWLKSNISRYQALVNDPTFTAIGNRSHRDKEPGRRHRTFFTDTLWSDSTIRSSQFFYKGFVHPEKWDGKPRPLEAQAGPGECRIVFSLGEGLGGPRYAEIKSIIIFHEINAYKSQTHSQRLRPRRPHSHLARRDVGNSSVHANPGLRDGGVVGQVREAVADPGGGAVSELGGEDGGTEDVD